MIEKPYKQAEKIVQSFKKWCDCITKLHCSIAKTCARTGTIPLWKKNSKFRLAVLIDWRCVSSVWIRRFMFFARCRYIVGLTCTQERLAHENTKRGRAERHGSRASFSSLCICIRAALDVAATGRCGAVCGCVGCALWLA